MVMAFFLIFYGPQLISGALVYFSSFAEGTNYANKMRDLLDSFQYNVALGTVDLRLERYFRSISLFVDSPVWGVMANDDLGKHSQLLDAFAQWGAGLGFILLYLIGYVQLRVLRTSNNFYSGSSGAAVGGLVAAIVVFGSNNAMMSSGIILYIVYPVFFRASSYSKKIAPAA